MSIERIKINGTEILTKNASDIQTFWTGNRYVKTDAQATFKAGGNQRCPIIRGIVFETGADNQISDNTLYNAGGFLVYPASGIPLADGNNYPYSDNIGRFLSLAIPGHDTFSGWLNNAEWNTYWYNTQKYVDASARPGYLISAPTNYLYNGSVSSGTYRLRAYRPSVTFGKDGGYEWIAYEIADFNITPLEKVAGGIFTFDRDLQCYDSDTGAARDIRNEYNIDYTNSYHPGYSGAPINWNFETSLNAVKDPANLNLGITA